MIRNCVFVWVVKETFPSWCRYTSEREKWKGLIEASPTVHKNWLWQMSQMLWNDNLAPASQEGLSNEDRIKYSIYLRHISMYCRDKTAVKSKMNLFPHLPKWLHTTIFWIPLTFKVLVIKLFCITIWLFCSKSSVWLCFFMKSDKPLTFCPLNNS